MALAARLAFHLAAARCLPGPPLIWLGGCALSGAVRPVARRRPGGWAHLDGRLACLPAAAQARRARRARRRDRLYGSRRADAARRGRDRREDADRRGGSSATPVAA